VRVLTRDAAAARRRLPSWDYGQLEFYEASAWAAGIRGASAVVNLAGEPVSGRWTSAVKEEILSSRVKATQLVVQAMAVLPEAERPAVLVSASAVGYYGASTSARFDEASASGGDHLALVCRRWEAAAAAAPAGVRCVVLRLGLVLDSGGGALAKMAPVFQAFAGGPIGDGRQWMSWIHRADVIGLLVRAMDDVAMTGAYNATAPTPVRMNDLVGALGQVMGRPSWLPVPEIAVQLLLGEGSKIVLEGQQVLPTRAIAMGYAFRHPEIKEGESCVGRTCILLTLPPTLALRAIITGRT